MLRMALLATILFLLGGFFAQAADYTVRLGEYEIRDVGAMTRFFTGNAELWRNPGVQVYNPKTGRRYSKTHWQMQHLPVNAIVKIKSDLVQTKLVTLNRLEPLTSVCQNTGVWKCGERLRAFNPNITNETRQLDVPSFFPPIQSPATVGPLARNLTTPVISANFPTAEQVGRLDQSVRALIGGTNGKLDAIIILLAIIAAMLLALLVLRIIRPPVKYIIDTSTKQESDAERRRRVNERFFHTPTEPTAIIIEDNENSPEPAFEPPNAQESESMAAGTREAEGIHGYWPTSSLNLGGMERPPKPDTEQENRDHVRRLSWKKREEKIRELVSALERHGIIASINDKQWPLVELTFSQQQQQQVRAALRAVPALFTNETGEPSTITGSENNLTFGLRLKTD